MSSPLLELQKLFPKLEKNLLPADVNAIKTALALYLKDDEKTKKVRLQLQIDAFRKLVNTHPTYIQDQNKRNRFLQAIQLLEEIKTLERV